MEESEAGNARLTYRMETREMARPTWDPIHASLSIVGSAEPPHDPGYATST